MGGTGAEANQTQDRRHVSTMKSATAEKPKRADTPAPVPAEKRKYRIIIVEEHAIVRQGLAQLINHQPGLSVVGEAETAARALELMRAQKPDLVILDVS